MAFVRRDVEGSASFVRWVRRTEDRRAAQRCLLGGDRDQHGAYAEMFEFPSYDDAMTNASWPETDKAPEGCRSSPSSQRQSRRG